MIAIELSSSYYRSIKKFVKGSKKRAELVKKALGLFQNNPKHPSLHTEKLAGSENWSIRINKSDRVFFMWLDKNSVLLIDVGKHDKYNKIK